MPIVNVIDIISILQSHCLKEEELKLKEKKKRITFFIGILLMVGMIIGVFVLLGEKHQEDKTKDISKEEKIAPEIIDDSVILSKDVTAWIEENKSKEGFYTKKADNGTFVLISGGEKNTTGYGIALNGVEQTNKKIIVKYEIVEPTEGQKVENQKSNPKMLMRFATTDYKIEGKVTTLESMEAEKSSKDKNKK